jgi:Raf kinase inhibitor-like YbhB/YbcL family protein
MRDPDAPVAGGFWHWVAFNIPAQTSALAAGSSWPKSAVSASNSTGAYGYVGPCPPPGKPHHYVFTLYALDVKTIGGADSATTGPQLLDAMKGHILGQAALTGLFGR